MQKSPNIHPGEVLLEEFLIPMAISQYKFAKDLMIPQTRVSEIVKKKTADYCGYCAAFEQVFWHFGQVLAGVAG